MDFSTHEPCIQRHEVWICINLDYIPVLPPNTTRLTLVNYKVLNFRRKSLSNLTKLPLEILEFKYPNWKQVATDVFTDIIHLNTLIIKKLNSPRKLHNLLLSLHFTNITTLHLNKVMLKRFSTYLFKGLHNTSLHHLHLINCGLENFNGTSISHLTKLQMLDLSFNNNLRIDTWGYLPTLMHLNLSDTYIDHFPQFQNEDSPYEDSYPELQTLVLSLSDEHNLNHHSFEGIPKLKRLKIQVKNDLFMAQGTIGNILPKLKNLLITGSPNVKFELEDKAIVSQSLKSLKLKNITLMSFGQPFSCPNLTNLTFSCFVAENPHQLIQILSTLNQLKYLEISKSQLYTVPISICNITSLTGLNLSGNFIYNWRYKDCQVMKNLKRFSLAANYIKNIKESSFAKALWDNEQLRWDLSSNNYYCSCNLLWFRNWLQSTQQRIIGYPKYYHCKLPSGLKIKIKSYIMSEEDCRNRFRISPLIIVAICLSSLSLITIICTVVAYVKRWSVRYWCNLLWDHYHHHKYTAIGDNIEYVYDAFVCYSSNDLSWILNKMIPIIEDTEGFQLCLHERDFMPGVDIVDNILECVRVSRKVVLILSPEFAQSTWCKYEASLAEQRLMEEKRDMLVPVLLEDIPDHIQTKRLATLLRRKTYLEWTENESQQENFWKRFVQILEKPAAYVEIWLLCMMMEYWKILDSSLKKKEN